MKKAFTMIELVFVVVIIGILAVVALPRFSATKYDAQAVKIATALAVCINDVGSYYIMNGTFSNKVTTYKTCKVAQKCFILTSSNKTGTLTVKKNGSLSRECVKAQIIARKNLLSRTHIFYF